MAFHSSLALVLSSTFCRTWRERYIRMVPLALLSIFFHLRTSAALSLVVVGHSSSPETISQRSWNRSWEVISDFQVWKFEGPTNFGHFALSSESDDAMIGVV